MHPSSLIYFAEVSNSINNRTKVTILLELIDALSACCLSVSLPSQYREWAAEEIVNVFAAVANRIPIGLNYPIADLKGIYFYSNVVNRMNDNCVSFKSNPFSFVFVLFGCVFVSYSSFLGILSELVSCFLHLFSSLPVIKTT